ncbi:DNA (cytosine-5-)-methyltransferase [Roseateles sp. L2-2]|uniref:DNA (cytosine-5-)-methyltransferase n=1 Tax=Roseateles sp. L2-2 TaxID=3422597 RepID=UPI003D364560
MQAKSFATKSLRFIDLFAGMGGFHRALAALGHECVMASELDEELRELYLKNFPSMTGKVFGDIRQAKQHVPRHDVLCGGFPCQPFSKSGAQLGTQDETRGTLFHEILEILEKHRPTYVLLENVGNFGRHDLGRTWQIVKRRLEALGYEVAGTEHSTPPSSTDWRDSGLGADAKRLALPETEIQLGQGLLSPHHFGFPHHRERFFIVASLKGLPDMPFPPRQKDADTTVASVVQRQSEIAKAERAEVSLTLQQVACIEAWNKLVQRIPSRIPFPAAPIWSDEFRFPYPFESNTPFSAPLHQLKRALGRAGKNDSREALLEMLPNYAREPVDQFRQWKINYIEKNRSWWRRIEGLAPSGWLGEISEMPPSLRKLEWNVKDGERDIWKYVLQFRPSGLRVKRYSSIPALVAMTTTQIPILGPERRFLTKVEGLRLQGFPDDHLLSVSRARSFKALGNGVHVGIVKLIAERLLGGAAGARSIGKTRRAQENLVL